MGGASASPPSPAWRSGWRRSASIAALGVGELIQASTLLYEGLRWAGVLFLLYLAWEGWTAKPDAVSSANLSRAKLFPARPRHQPAQPQGGGLLRRRAADLRRRWIGRSFRRR